MLTINFSQVLENGYGPYAPGLSKLVWDSQTGTMYITTFCVLCQISGLTFSVLFSYFIGYVHGIDDEPRDRSNIKIGPEAIACYGLAKPFSNEWLNKNWNGDTTDWKM